MDEIDLLISNLTGDSLGFRSALRELAWIDDERAINATINAINEWDMKVRDAAFGGLSRGGKLVISGLLNALYHEEWIIRQFVCEVLAEIKEQSTSRPIAEMLARETKQQVRLDAIIALGEIANPDAIPYLLPFLQSENKFCRWAAVGALGEIGNEESLNAIATCLNDSDEDIKNEARKYLQK